MSFTPGAYDFYPELTRAAVVRTLHNLLNPPGRRQRHNILRSLAGPREDVMVPSMAGTAIAALVALVVAGVTTLAAENENKAPAN